jgi:hypothetical protein
MADADDRRIARNAREPQPLSAERLEQLRARVDAGVYSSEPVLQATARAILERRDL